MADRVVGERLVSAYSWPRNGQKVAGEENVCLLTGYGCFRGPQLGGSAFVYVLDDLELQ